FPPRYFWPWNVRLGVLDSLTDPPLTLVNQYDVVHVRMWASNLKENDIGPLVRHIKLLLSESFHDVYKVLWNKFLQLIEPGGYIQWEDADLVNQAVSGDQALQFATMMSELFKRA